MGSQIAAEMRERLKEVIGLTGCAGIAWNKLLAKLVGERHKPNDQTTLFPGREQQLMTGLGKARRIPGRQNIYFIDLYFKCTIVLESHGVFSEKEEDGFTM